MATNQWFCDKMLADRLLARGELTFDTGEFQLELWTQHREDEPTWGGVEYSYSRGGTVKLTYCAFPLLQPPMQCAIFAMNDWEVHPHWRRSEEAVFTLLVGQQAGAHRQSPSQPLILQHLARAQGLLERRVEAPGSASGLCRSLSHRLNGLIAQANQPWRAIAKI